MNKTKAIPSGKILIVEDDLMLGEMLQEIIGSYHETILLTSAKKVFETVTKGLMHAGDARPGNQSVDTGE